MASLLMGTPSSSMPAPVTSNTSPSTLLSSLTCPTNSRYTKCSFQTIFFITLATHYCHYECFISSLFFFFSSRVFGIATILPTAQWFLVNQLFHFYTFRGHLHTFQPWSDYGPGYVTNFSQDNKLVISLDTPPLTSSIIITAYSEREICVTLLLLNARLS